jgi:mRNA-degrading endonuclease YafQ of YafQ-DinJ toxin-antitoxin module
MQLRTAQEILAREIFPVKLPDFQLAAIPQEIYTYRDMWTVYESRAAAKSLARVPRQVGEKYELWLAIVRQSGPTGLRLIRGFYDEALSGKWGGFRSSRLSAQWRVIYRVESASISVYVIEVTPHEYRR